MPCYHPLKGFVLGIKSNGKKNIIIRSYNVNHIEINKKDDKIYDVLEDTHKYANTKIVNEYIDIPCGKCIGCRLDYRRSWTARLLCELETQREGACSYFVTLTYSDDNLPLTYSDGSDKPVATVNYSDFQRFIKDLRYAAKCIDKESHLRYFVASEYGSSTLRCHFHAILFDCPIPDLKLFSIKKGEAFYTSEWLERIWKFGNILIGRVTPASCGYVAGYCCKKVFGQDKAFFEALGVNPECIHMSTNPGIGYAWLQKHPDVLKSPSLVISTEKGGKKYCIPKYFMVKLSESQENSNFVELLKEQRLKYFRENRALSDLSSSKPYLERLKDLEMSQIKKYNKERDIDESKKRS